MDDPSGVVEEFLVALESGNADMAKAIIHELMTTQEVIGLLMSKDAQGDLKYLLALLLTIADNYEGNAAAAKLAAEKVTSISFEIGRRLFEALGCPQPVQPNDTLRQSDNGYYGHKNKKAPKVRGLPLDEAQLASINSLDNQQLAPLLQNCFPRHRLDPSILCALLDIAEQEGNWNGMSRRGTLALKPSARLLGLIVALLENGRETGQKSMTYEQVQQYCCDNSIYSFERIRTMMNYFNELMEYLEHTRVIISEGKTIRLQYKFPDTEE